MKNFDMFKNSYKARIYDSKQITIRMENLFKYQCLENISTKGTYYKIEKNKIIWLYKPNYLPLSKQKYKSPQKIKEAYEKKMKKLGLGNLDVNDHNDVATFEYRINNSNATNPYELYTMFYKEYTKESFIKMLYHVKNNLKK